MKRIKYILLISCTLLLAQCNEEFLDNPPLGKQSEAAFEPWAAVVSAYNALGSINDRWSNWKFAVAGDLMSDDAWKGGSSINDAAFFVEMSYFITTANNRFVKELWDKNYQHIYLCNWAIENISKSTDIPEDKKQRYVSELKFLRSYFYFILIRNFGGVPLVTKPLTDPNQFTLKRSSIDDSWAQVEQDLKDAIQTLPPVSEIKRSELGRATKGAAQSLLAKVYLYQQKWQECENVCKNVINSQDYSLMTDFADIFGLSGEYCSESIFEINFTQSPEGSNVTSHGESQRSRNNGYKGWGLNTPTADLLNAFEPGDPRIIHTLLFEGDKEISAPDVAMNFSGYYNPDKMHNRKVWIPLNMYPEIRNNWEVNIRVLRYSDVLLMFAEAANELGHTAAALEKINMVRERARNSSKTDKDRIFINYQLEEVPDLLPDITVTDKNELREMIWHERRVEFAMEGERFYDLARQGRAGKVLREFALNYNTDKGERFVDGVHEVLPLPQIEIDRTMGLIQQNEGYN